MTPPDSIYTRFLRGEPLLLALMAGLLWLDILDFPHLTLASLDPSWQSSLVSAHRAGLQFGHDLIFTYGPLGWLHSSFYPPGSITAKLTWELGGKLLLVAALSGISLRLSRPDRWLFLVVILLFAPFFSDTLIILVITLTLIAWVIHTDAPRWLAVTTLLGIAILSQVKFTYALLAGVGIVAALASLVLQDRPKRATALGVVFVSAYLLSWMLAGQSLAGLPEYWRQSWAISQGYPWAMSLPPPHPLILAAGVATAAINIAIIVHIGLKHPQKAIAWPTLILIGSAWFLSWKHGFARADIHVLSFFLTSMFITFALPDLLKHRPAWRWYWLGPAVCLLWLHDERVLLDTPYALRDRLCENAGKLASLPRLGNTFVPSTANSALARAIGDASVDVYNYEQGIVQLAGLRYHPRPILQGYNAYTPALLKKNLDFLRSPDSADCVLLKIQSIDNRHPMLDDSPSMMEIPLRYAHVADIDDYALFKKRPGASPADPLRDAPLLLNQTVKMGETIRLPTAQTKAIWLTLKARPSLLGKIRAAAYQPAELYMVTIQADGGETRHRLIVPMAEAGFLVQPLIETTADYIAFTQGSANRPVEAIRFEPRTPSGKRYWDPLEIRLSSLGAYPLRNTKSPLLLPDAPFNLRPARITSAFPEERFGLDQKTAIIVQAPGAMIFNVPPGVRTLRASFGLLSASYTEGRTDGVTFAVIQLSANQQELILFKRHLAPLSVPTDRGTQTLELPLDDPSSSRTVILRTLPGPFNNADWDWSYWTQIRFLP